MRPSTRRIPLLAAALAAALAPGALLAQREGYTYLSYVGPDVSLVSPSEEEPTARLNTPVLAGDVLVTGNASRAEAILADGNVVRLDVRSELRFERIGRTYESDDDRTILALARGSAVIEVRDAPTREQALRLDTDDATVVSTARSVFRVDASRRGTEVYVLAGRVEVNGRGGRALVKAGEYAFVSGDDEIDVEASEVPRDRFTRFVEERRARSAESDTVRYVGTEYAYDAAALETSGSWTYVASAGAWAWRPEVESGWMPYSLGTWRWTPAGMTWVSYEPWGWLPYHYGTWIFDDLLGWVWIPADVYSPAWVYWSYGPDWTGWCPVGWVSGPWYDTYYRSTRLAYGNERGGPWLPNLRGKVEVKEIDRRGWNFVPTARLGRRLVPGRDVTRGDRVPFPRGETVVVSTAPLRVARGASPVQAVQDAIRRSAPSDGRRAGASDGLASILRRDRTLDAAGQDLVLRSLRPSRDPDTRTAIRETTRTRERVEPWRDAGDRAPRAGPAPGQPERVRTDDGWRASSSVPPTRVERREGDLRDRQGDSGWRAPSPRVIDRSGDRTADRPSDPVRREGGVAAREAPIREAPARRDVPPSVMREAPREAPARYAPAPSAPAPVRAAPAYSAPSSPPSAPAPVRAAPVYSAPSSPPAAAAAPGPAAAPVAPRR